MSERFRDKAKALRQELERCGFVLVPAQLVRDCDELIAIELAAAEASALERAAQEFTAESVYSGYAVSQRLRALIPPAAAPELCGNCRHPKERHARNGGTCLYIDSHRNECACTEFEPAAAPAAETGKAQGAPDELAAVLRGKDEMGERLAKALGVPAGPLGRLVDAAIARIEAVEAMVGRCEEALLVPDPRKERKLLADLALDRNRPRTAPTEEPTT